MTFVDTPGAYPGIDAEDAASPEAIGRNLLRNGGTEGAGHRHHHRRGRLRWCPGDCRRRRRADAAVLDLFGHLAGRLCVHPLEERRAAADAAETMGITAQRLKTLGLVDKIVSGPGVRTAIMSQWRTLKKSLQDALKQLSPVRPMNCSTPVSIA